MPLPSTMRYIAVREPGPPDVLVEVDGSVAAAKARRGPDRSCVCGRQPSRLPAEVRRLSAAGRCVADHRPRGRGTNRGVGRRRHGVEHRRRGLRAHARRRLCRILRDAWRASACPSPPGCRCARPRGFPRITSPSGTTSSTACILPPAKSILIHGGTSGIGLTAIQLAKAFGATVFTTAGSAEKVAFCTSMGADHAFDYKVQDFVAEVARITAKRGVNVVLDMVGGDYVDKNLKCLALEGRLSQIGLLNGPRADIGMHHIMVKRLTVTGSTLRASPAARKVGARELAARQGVAALRAAATEDRDPGNAAARARRRRARVDGVGQADRESDPGSLPVETMAGLALAILPGSLLSCVSTSRGRPRGRTPRRWKTSSPRSRASTPSPRFRRRCRSGPAESSTA